MTVPENFVEQLLTPVVRWLETGGDAWAMDVDYWKRRRTLLGDLRATGDQFEGPAATVLGNIDTAMDVFRPEPNSGFEPIDESQLRTELLAAIDKLRTLGYSL